MTSFRSIFITLTICLVALAQQLCCCMVAPAVNSLLAADPAAAHSHCCHHDCDDNAPADPGDDQDSLPGHEDCECRLGRILVQIEAKLRPFADGGSDPGVPQVESTTLMLVASFQPDPFAISARAGPSPGSLAGPAGPPATPHAQRVLLTV